MAVWLFNGLGAEDSTGARKKNNTTGILITCILTCRGDLVTQWWEPQVSMSEESGLQFSSSEDLHFLLSPLSPPCYPWWH